MSWQPNDLTGTRRPADMDASRSVSPGWMITFADLLALLVSFFVLLFATTTVEPAKWRRVVQPMHPYVAGTVLHPQDRPPVAQATAPPGHDLNYIEVLLRQWQDTHPIISRLGLELRDHALLLHLPAGFLRAGPGADANPAEAPAELAFTRLLSELDNHLEIVVHGPAEGTATPTTAGAKDIGAPWRLMLDQGSALAGRLADAGVTRPVTVTALVDLPLSSEGAQIDLIIHDQAGLTTDGDAHAP